MIRFKAKLALIISMVTLIGVNPIASEKEAINNLLNNLYGGTLVIGTSTQPTPINPIFTTHSISAFLSQLIFNSLIRLNSKGEIEADLAQSWQISDDGFEYIFNIRKGVD